MSEAPFSAPDPDEAARLEAFAAELRAAHPDPPLSAGFAERLSAPAAAPWSFRRALRHNALLRVAAALLVTCAASVPVLAVVQLLRRAPVEPPVFGYLPRAASPAVAAPPGADLRTVAPATPDPAELYDDGWVVAVERDNRLARASLRWHRAFPVAAPGDPAALSTLGAAARAGLELRFGLRRAEALPVPADWSHASAEELWLELERRLALAAPSAPMPPLVTRVRQLWQSDVAAQPWLAGWIRILDGAAPPVPALRPGGEDLRLFWEAADRDDLLWPSD